MASVNKVILAGNLGKDSRSAPKNHMMKRRVP